MRPEFALEKALQLEAQGADIIDIGAESTRPDATQVTFEEEINRLFPVLDEILKLVTAPVSIDTTKAKVADLALAKGVSIVNDVSGLKDDPEMAHVVHQHQAGVVVMHRRGTPQTMQNLTHYENLIEEVKDELSESIAVARKAGISHEQIAIDPGLGFSKTANQNFEIVRSLSEFKCFERPIVVGASRKSFLGKVTGKETRERVFASAAIAALLVERGAHVLRVHDVSATRDAVFVTREIVQ